MVPGSPPRSEWHQSFSLDEIYKFASQTAKTIPTLNNDSKFFLLQVWQGFELLGAVLCSRAKDMTITICPNKPPDKKWGWSVDDIMPRRDGPENLKNFEKESVEIGPLRWELDSYHGGHELDFDC